MTASLHAQIAELIAEDAQHNDGISTAALLEGVLTAFEYTAPSSELLECFFTIHKPSAKGHGPLDLSDLGCQSDPVPTSYWMFADGSMFYWNEYIDGAID